MNDDVMLIDKENRELFEPYIMPDIWQHIEDNDVFGLGITEEDDAVGAIVCSCDDGIVDLLSVGVLPSCHRRGFARQLLGCLEQVCSRNSFYEIHARYFMGEQERVPIESLLTSCGYSIRDGEFRQVSFMLGDLKGSRAEKQLQKSHQSGAMQKLVLFGKLNQQQQQWLLGQVSILREECSSISPTRSCISVRNGQIAGAVFMSERDRLLEIVQLYSSPGMDVASMVCLFASMGEAYATLPPDTMVRFQAVDDIASDLIEKLLDGCKIQSLQERIAYRVVPIIPISN